MIDFLSLPVGIRNQFIESKALIPGKLLTLLDISKKDEADKELCAIVDLFNYNKRVNSFVDDDKVVFYYPAGKITDEELDKFIEDNRDKSND